MLSSCLGKSSMPRHRKAELGKLQLPSLPPLRAWKTLIDQAGVREYFEPMSPCRQFPDDVFIAIAIHNLKPPANAAFPVLSATGQYGDFYWLSMALVLCCIWVKETPSAIRNVCAYHNSHAPVVVDKGFVPGPTALVGFTPLCSVQATSP